MSNSLRNMIKKRQQGIICGVTSYCTANGLVIEAILKQAKRFNDEVLIEATANQVNQFGGYTGMKPIDFKNFVYQIADDVDFPKEKIILGGDHLGPLKWSDDIEDVAMEKDIELVKSYVSTGFKKIHLDTSMKLADDSGESRLSDEIIARRGAILYGACEDAYQELLKSNPDEEKPVFIIGSEVPIPGGVQEEEDNITVTSPEAVSQTINAYKEQFKKLGFRDAFENVIGIVVQPGVEFGNSDIHHYDHSKAKELCKYINEYDGIVFESHSTDYQSSENLRKMVEDGIAILKVGPVLTFALREGLLALSMIEKELISPENRAEFMEKLERVMIKNPENWRNHYSGSEKELKLQRKFSFSDRCRYYFAKPEIRDAIDILFGNLQSVDIPLGILRQFMPLQYIKVRDGKISLDPRDLVLDRVVELVESYNYATKHNYMIPEIFVN